MWSLIWFLGCKDSMSAAAMQEWWKLLWLDRLPGNSEIHVHLPWGMVWERLLRWRWENALWKGSFPQQVILIFSTELADWEDWGDFSECSTTCGAGYQIRTRRCINPKTSAERPSSDCFGHATEMISCPYKPCPGEIMTHLTITCVNASLCCLWWQFGINGVTIAAAAPVKPVARARQSRLALVSMEALQE